jgi:nucleotide-binding universal stress UspA family protein
MAATTLRILVPVDFSPSADAARRYAATLAARLDASLELLHAVEASADERESVVAEATRRLEGWRSRTARTGLSVSAVVRVGAPARAIPDYVAAARVDMVVMGRCGDGAPRDRVGSVAACVLQDVACPVVMLREAAAAPADSWWPSGQTLTLRAALGRGGTSRE